MKRRSVTALFLALLMVTALFGVPKKVSAANTIITIAADKTEAEPGDTINYSITLGPVSEMGTMQMLIVIPEGLTYVQGSGALAPDLKETLGFDMADFIENYKQDEKRMMVNGVASAADYSSDGDTPICTFSCTVDEGFHGKAEVTLTRLEFYSCQTWVNHTSEYSVQTAVVTVAGEPVTYALDKTFINVAVKGTEQLTLVGSDGSIGEGTWTSEDPSVATVDQNGLVTGVKYQTGTVKIHVAMDNGYEADCEVQTRFWDVNGSPDKEDEDYQYYYSAVYWGADHTPAITKGYDLEYFGIGEGCKRKDFILFLYRLAGQPSVSNKDIKAMKETFSDMADSDLSNSFIKAIAWGYSASDPNKRIINGYNDSYGPELAGTFGPERTITRKEAILMIWRYAGKPDSESTARFEKFDEIVKGKHKLNQDAYKAIRWAAWSGMSNGYQRADQLPEGVSITTPCYGSDLTCLREDMIVFLYRYAQKFLGE